MLARDESLTNILLLNIQNDLNAMSFPVGLKINSQFISVFVSFLVALISYFFVVKDFSIANPVEIIKTILKLFFVYSGSLFSMMYILRLYSLSRGVSILAIIIFPIISYLFLLLLHLEVHKKSFNKYIVIGIPLIIFITMTIFLVRNSNDDGINYAVPIPEVNEINYGLVDEECSSWKGSDNYKNCNSGVTITKLASYKERVTNIITNNDQIYVLENGGNILQYPSGEIFLDLTSKVGVFEDFFESGLFSLAFHPEEDYFIVSYSDLNNNLVFEKFYMNLDLMPNLEINSEILMRIPNSQCCHYSGNIIWSKYFEDFLISVGDMQLKEGYNHSDPLDTTSPRGKILFLNKQDSNPDLLALEKNQSPRNDILAFGLRNPWQTSEYKNFLFVPDIGNSLEEELNIVDLNKFKNDSKPYLFGWPYFEGNIDKGVKFNQILLHSKDSSVPINEYVIQNSIKPKVFYSHQGPENFRAAIIGGGVIEDSDSDYFEIYFFADYLSAELFGYDFKKNELSIFPLGNLDSYITSLTINPSKSNSVLITTGAGSFLEISLP